MACISISAIQTNALWSKIYQVIFPKIKVNVTSDKFRRSSQYYCATNLWLSISMLSPGKYPKTSNKIFNIGKWTLQTNWRFIGLGVLHKSSKLATAGEILNRSDRASVKTGARQTSSKSNYPAALTTDSLSDHPINASTIHLCTTLLHSLYFVFYTAWPGRLRLVQDKTKLKWVSTWSLFKNTTFQKYKWCNCL